jgi:hypothetical protein
MGGIAGIEAEYPEGLANRPHEFPMKAAACGDRDPLECFWRRVIALPLVLYFLGMVVAHMGP